MRARDTIRRIGLRGVVVLGVLGGYTALGAGPAAALVGYSPVTPNAVFGASGSGEGQFSTPLGVAVDNSSGDVYVVDRGNNRVQKFDAEGNYLAQFNGSDNPSFPEGFSSPSGIAVDDSSGVSKDDVYVIDTGHNVIDKFSSKGVFVSELNGFGSAVLGVAVDPSGDLWVSEADGFVQEFSAEGVPLDSLDLEYAEGAIAVDSEDNVYVNQKGALEILKFNLAGSFLAEGAGCNCTTALAVDPSTNELFFDERGVGIVQYSAFWEPISPPIQTFGSAITPSEGIAVNSVTHIVYVSQREADTVAIFKPGLLFPDVTTDAASNVMRTSAKLEGVVNPDGQEVTSCEFEYGTSTAYGQTVPCTPAPGSGSSPVPVSAELSGLALGTTYHYRLVAGNSNGLNPGADMTFTTPNAVLELQTEAASNIEEPAAGTIVATLNGSFAPDGADTHYYFEYGETEAYGSVSPALPGTDAGSAFKLEHAQTKITGLKGETTYHFRLVATNSFGTTRGADTTFTTPLTVPELKTEAASSVEEPAAGTIVATLNGSLAPDGADTHYYFEYGETEAYGSVSPALPGTDAGSAFKLEHAQTKITGLKAETTYHFRLVATNSFGTTRGADTTFTTPLTVPELKTEAASSVEEPAAGTIVATLNGLLAPDGADTHYYFEYGETEAYGSVSPALPGTDAGSAFKLEHAQTKITGLKAETTYHFRLVATNSFGTTYGTAMAFTTPGTVPELKTEAATDVEEPVAGTIVATLNGSLAPDGADTHYYFEYGETEAYGSVSPALPGTDAGSAFKLEHAQTKITGLKPFATYHFRLVATNSFGTTHGADMTFPATSPPVPGALPASNVTQFTATLNGTIETGEAFVNYHFEYGTTTAYGSIAPIPDDVTPITTETVPVSQPVNGLQAGTTYHYRLVASSPGATEVKGPDETFTTLPVPAPTVETGAASGVGVGSATLGGTIDPHGWDTTYLFQYGTSAAYGQSWPTVQVDMGALEGPQPVVVNLPNLLPSTTYHYRLVATNGGGTSYGPDMAFTTGEYPAQVIQEPVALRTLLVPSEAVKSPAKKAKKAKKHKKRPQAKRRARRKKR